MADGAPWYETFFDADYLRVYDHQFTPERAEKEVAFAERALGLAPASSLLDLCCGQGRHAILFAGRGHEVTAQDLSPEYIDLAGRAAAAAGVTLRTVAADMRAIPFEGEFDAVVNMFTSFGYLETEAEDRKALEAIARALKPGGRLLLDLVNREWVVDNYIQNDWHSGNDGALYLEHRELDLVTSRNHVTFTAIAPDGGRKELAGHHVRLYTLTELIGLLAGAGLDFGAVYGGFEAQPYAITTRRMIVVARKR